jgi:hypothetical protein
MRTSATTCNDTHCADSAPLALTHEAAACAEVQAALSRQRCRALLLEQLGHHNGAVPHCTQRGPGGGDQRAHDTCEGQKLCQQFSSVTQAALHACHRARTCGGKALCHKPCLLDAERHLLLLLAAAAAVRRCCTHSTASCCGNRQRQGVAVGPVEALLVWPVLALPRPRPQEPLELCISCVCCGGGRRWWCLLLLLKLPPRQGVVAWRLLSKRVRLCVAARLVLCLLALLLCEGLLLFFSDTHHHGEVVTLGRRLC